jgi:2-polyprenyl-6-methoxyphenol hydroxylase-like FAD-dependent oxidoreductase
MGQQLGERAIVVGGGMGGLFSARVLSDHFGEVVVLDRDEAPGSQARKMIPQGNHFHVLLPGGLDAMAEWFPGFVDDLVESGSVEMQLGRDFYAYTLQGKSYSIQQHQPDPIAGGDMTYVQTRPQLEHNVRQRVASLPNVSFRYGVLVEGPVNAGDRVTGVAIRGEEPLCGDLVVDASGRNSLTARWLPDLGFEPVPETYVNCDVSYASVVCKPKDWDAFEGSVFFLMPSGAGDQASRGGAIVKLPNGEWLVNLNGRYGDTAPTDWDGFRAFGETLIHPIWSELVETVAPLGDITTYRMKRAVRRHYEALDRFPEGLLPIGDSVCFFNPTHGQGMSAAAGQMRGLADLLEARSVSGQRLEGLSTEFFPVAAEWVRGPWILAAMSDFENPMCTGDFPEADLPDLMRLGAAVERATESPEVGQLVLDIAVLRRPLSAIRTLTPNPSLDESQNVMSGGR